MLPGNGDMAEKVTKAIETHGKKGWLRCQECAKIVAKDSFGRVNESERVRYMRWKKQVKKGKVEDFRAYILPGNISYIGLKSSRVEDIKEFKEVSEFIEGKNSIKQSSARLSFFQWLESWTELKHLARNKEEERNEKKVRSLECEREILHEIMDLPDQHSPEEEWQIKKKWLKRYGLDRESLE